MLKHKNTQSQLHRFKLQQYTLNIFKIKNYKVLLYMSQI